MSLKMFRLLLLVIGSLSVAHGQNITHTFSGHYTETAGPVAAAGIQPGTRFIGSYTFRESAQGVEGFRGRAFENAINSWTIELPTVGLRYTGSSGTLFIRNEETDDGYTVNLRNSDQGDDFFGFEIRTTGEATLLPNNSLILSPFDLRNTDRAIISSGSRTTGVLDTFGTPEIEISRIEWEADRHEHFVYLRSASRSRYYDSRSMIFVDTDESNATGYRAYNVGAEYLIRGDRLFRFTGTHSSAWSWQDIGAVIVEANRDRSASLRIPRSLLPGDQVSYVFFGANKPESPQNFFFPESGADSAALPSASVNITTPLDLRTIEWKQGQNQSLALRYRVRSPGRISDAQMTFIDNDVNPVTGYEVFELGAEFMVRNGKLFRYAGTGSDWQWELVQRAEIRLYTNVYEFTFDKTSGLNSGFRYLYYEDNRIIGGTGTSVFPATSPVGTGEDLILPDVGPYQFTNINGNISGSRGTLELVNDRAWEPDENLTIYLRDLERTGPGFSVSGFEATHRILNGILSDYNTESNQWIALSNVDIENFEPEQHSLTFFFDNPFTNTRNGTPQYFVVGNNKAASDNPNFFQFGKFTRDDPSISVRTVDCDGDQIEIGPFQSFRREYVFFDTDKNASSGYRIYQLGSDYMVNGTSLFRYTGNGSNWSWEEVLKGRETLSFPKSIFTPLIDDNTLRYVLYRDNRFLEPNDFIAPDQSFLGLGGQYYEVPCSDPSLFSIRIDGDSSDWINPDIAFRPTDAGNIKEVDVLIEQGTLFLRLHSLGSRFPVQTWQFDINNDGAWDFETQTEGAITEPGVITQTLLRRSFESLGTISVNYAYQRGNFYELAIPLSFLGNPDQIFLRLVDNNSSRTGVINDVLSYFPATGFIQIK